MSHVLVTGGAGFLGSHLCDRLIQQGHQVTCVDNFFTGQKSNIAHLLPHPNFTLLQHDIIEPLFFNQAVNQIYNLACPASPVHYQHNPVRTIKANTVGMINMLGIAKKKRARLLQASTSEVYGDPDIHPQTEDYRGNVNCLGYRACYDEGKRVAETLCMDYHRSHQIDIRLVRIFNTYGPRMHPRDGRVVSNFILQALSSEPITIYGDGSQTRSFCYVDDLIEAIIRMMNQTATLGPVNLGNPSELSIKLLAQKIISLTQSPSSLVLKQLPADDPRQRQPDITLAKKILNWEPTTDLTEGLKQTITYFNQLSPRAIRPRRQ
jgi:UDP-glucuronate decarboxylase